MRKVLLAAALLLCALVLGWDEVRERYVFLQGRLYPREASILVLPEGIPGDVAVLGEFGHLKWLDLRGRGLTPARIEALQQAAGRARLLWQLDFQGQRLDGNARAVQVRHLDAGGSAA